MHSENSAVLKDLIQHCKLFLQKYEGSLVDIIVFGSLMREKSLPRDIDLALLVQKQNGNFIEKIQTEIKNLLPESKIDFTILTMNEVYSPFWLTIMKEGFSITREQSLTQLYGLQPMKLFKYSIKMLTPVQKVQFDRGLRKMIETMEGIHLVRTVVLIPLQKSEQFEEFLRTWNIAFEARRYELLPEHLKQERTIPGF